MHKIQRSPLILLNFHPRKKPQNVLFLVLNTTNIALQECASMTCAWCMSHSKTGTISNPMLGLEQEREIWDIHYSQ